MSARTDNLRAAVMAALEQAARVRAMDTLMTDGWCKSDEQAVRYGVLTPKLSSYTDGFITGAQLRRVLSAEVAAGRVLSHQNYPGAMISWWPVGLWDILQAERAAQSGGAA